MVCPYLIKGDCKITDNTCKRDYMTKMANYRKCYTYKRRGSIKKKAPAKKRKTTRKKK